MLSTRDYSKKMRKKLIFSLTNGVKGTVFFVNFGSLGYKTLYLPNHPPPAHTHTKKKQTTISSCLATILNFGGTYKNLSLSEFWIEIV